MLDISTNIKVQLKKKSRECIAGVSPEYLDGRAYAGGEVPWYSLLTMPQGHTRNLHIRDYGLLSPVLVVEVSSAWSLPLWERSGIEFSHSRETRT